MLSRQQASFSDPFIPRRLLLYWISASLAVWVVGVWNLQLEIAVRLQTPLVTGLLQRHGYAGESGGGVRRQPAYKSCLIGFFPLVARDGHGVFR